MPTPIFAYQEVGADWIARRERGGLLDRPGCGKTCETIRAFDLRRHKRILIICPAHLRANWIGEFRKFAHIDRRVAKGRSMHDFVAWSRGVFDVLVVSFELAVKWAPHFHAHAELLDAVVIDEFQYLNNLETARAQAVLGKHGDGTGGLVMWGVQSWALTGTLMTNDPAQCYAFLRFTRALELPFATFVRRYFTTRASTWGQRNKPRPEMVEELRALIANNSISRSLADVGYQLPPIFLTTTLVDGDTEEIRQLLAAHPGLDDAIVKAIGEGGLSFLDSQHVATLRRLLAEAKAVPYASMLIDELEADPDHKMVVFANSRNALLTVRDALARRNIWCVLVQGGISERARDEAVTAFQGNAACRVFLGNHVAAGTGLTLTASAHLDMLESSWVPGTIDQTIKRIRRIGQERQQHARFITLARSLDEVVTRTVIDKAKNIAMLEGDEMIAPPEDA